MLQAPVPMEEEEHLLGRADDHQGSSEEDGFQHV